MLLTEEINKLKQEDNKDSFFEVTPQMILKSAFVDVDKPLVHPPIALSIGCHTFGTQTYPTPFATYGNFTCIIGASKSRKTFFKSALTAAYIGGRSNNYFPEVRTARDTELFVIDIDTEQSEYHAQRVFKRVCAMVGNNYKNYKPFALRPYSHVQRVQFIEYVLYESEFKSNIGLMCIDGLADLISDINNITEATDIIQKLMKWTDDKKIHIITNLHTNYDSKKARGHLGSTILQKAETIAHVEKGEDGWTNVTFPYSRGVSPDDLKFKINENGIPTTETHIQTPTMQGAIQPNKNFEEPPF